jgi:hypothetical protein
MTVIPVVNYFGKSVQPPHSYHYCMIASDGSGDTEVRGGRIVLPPLSTVVTQTTRMCVEDVVCTASGMDIVGQDGNSLGLDYHDTFILNGMDHHEWDMESPPDRSGVPPQTH